MRLLQLVFAVLLAVAAALVAAPSAAAVPPLRLAEQVTDRVGALDADQAAQLGAAVDRLYDDRSVRLWVVFVDDFGTTAAQWGEQTAQRSEFGDRDALLAVATEARSYTFLVPSDVASQRRVDALLDERVEPALRDGDFPGAALAAAAGLTDTGGGGGGGVPWSVFGVGLLVLAVACAVLLWRSRRRRRRRVAAEVDTAQRVDATDPRALAPFSDEALDELSRLIVVDVDNAVRTSEAELSLADGEWGEARTAPFRAAVTRAKEALAQAFSTRQTLDDDVPETPAARRDLLLRVIVAAAGADRELDAQADAFEALRDLLVDAPGRLDALTRRVVELTARVEPARGTLDGLAGRYAETVLASVADNVAQAQGRLGFAETQIGAARDALTRGASEAVVDAVHAAEGALTQAETLLRAVETAAADIDRAVAGLPAAVADLRTGIAAASAAPTDADGDARGLDGARTAAQTAVDRADAHGATDPLGAMTAVVRADADLDAALSARDARRADARRRAQVIDETTTLVTAHLRAVSDYIDTRRGTVGATARTRLAEATRRSEAAAAVRATDPDAAVAHLNEAARLVAQAQQAAHDDVAAAQRHVSPGGGYGGGFGGGDYGGGTWTGRRGGSGDLGAVLGGILIDSAIRGGAGGWGGSFGGGRSAGRSTSFGGAGRSSGRSYSGRSGRF